MLFVFEVCIRRLADVCQSGRRPMYVPRLLLLLKALENTPSNSVQNKEELMKLKVDLLSVTDQINVTDLFTTEYSQSVIIEYAIEKLNYFRLGRLTN